MEYSGYIFIFILLFFLKFIFNIYVRDAWARRYIKLELSRAYSKKEYAYWRKEQRKFYLRAIPFLSFFLKKHR